MSRNWPEFVYPIANIAARAVGVLRGRGYPLHRGEEVRPFFIVGSGRCGSTLLRRILQVNEQVHIPPETYVLGPAIRFFRCNRDRPWHYLVAHVLSMFEYHPHFEAFGVSLRPLAVDLADAPAASRSLAMILDRFYRYHGRQTGQTLTRWGDKTPLNTYHLEPIRSVFPDARFVHLLRDGVDVVCSRIRAGLEPDVAGAAARWTSAVQAAMGFSRKHPDMCIEVRYEALVRDPSAEVSRICTFLDLSFDPAMLASVEHAADMGDVPREAHHAGVLEPVTTRSIGKGRNELGAAEKRELQRLIGSLLERLGYEPTE